MDLSTITRPSDRRTVKVNGSDQIIFFSYKRLNSVLRILGGPENIAAVLVDPDTSEMILKVLLAPTTGPEAFDFELGEDTLSADDVDALLCWAQEHLSFFYVKRFQLLGDHQKSLEPLLAVQKSPQSGSEPSTSSEQSVGAST